MKPKMWTLDSEQVIAMVNGTHGRLSPTSLHQPKMLEIGQVVGKISWNGMLISKNDCFILNELNFLGRAGLFFRYWKTATWFYLTALH